MGARRKIFIAFTERAKRRVKRLGRKFPKPHRLRAVRVDDSLAALRELQGQMIADRESNPPLVPADSVQARSGPRPPEEEAPPDERPPEEPPDEQPPTPIRYDLNIDVKRNVVVAIVEQQVTPELAAAFTQRYGVDVVVEQGHLAKPDACDNRFACGPDLRGGLATVLPGSPHPCSTAFNVRNESFVYAILSAGHCGDPDPDMGADRSHGLPAIQYGQVVDDELASRVDAELHTVGNGFTATKPWIYVSDALKNVPVSRVGKYDELLVGQKVCKSGVGSVTSCGEVLGKHYSPSYVPNGQDFIRTSYCAQSRDSGGAVYRRYPVFRTSIAPRKPGAPPLTPTRYEALGVHSGGSDLEDCTKRADYSIFGHIEFVTATGAFPYVKVLTVSSP